MIAQVRRFNRRYTQRVGALETHYLARDRPLGEARVLWEISDDGRDVKELRQQLDLDSGYLSRLLRSLEAAGLVTVGPSPADGRVRTARLTAAGRAERAVLDRRSDELAGSLLEPLSAGQRERLVGALEEVERLLDAGLVAIDVIDPGLPVAQRCLQAYYDELDRRFATGFDPARARPTAVDDMRPPAGAFLVATRRGEPLGCGALKFHPDGVAELKRLWVDAAARGLGVGRRLVARLEAHAAGQRRQGGPPRHQRRAHRGHRPLPQRRVPRDPRLQRRGLRRPLVREAPRHFPRIGRGATSPGKSGS